MRRALLLVAFGLGCNDGRPADSMTTSASTTSTTSTTASTGASSSTDPTTGASATESSGGTTDVPTSSSGSGTSQGGCGACAEPNQTCVDGECVTSCQGQEPDPCGPAQVCDIISGTCKDADAPCTLAGAADACGDKTCGPGSVCDGVGACLAVAPCAAVACTGAGACWGTLCTCERGATCQDAPLDQLNGPFSQDITGIDFDDDCIAWSVTISGGQEFLRRLTPAGDLQTWGGVGDYDQGEVRVLRHLTIPQLHSIPPIAAGPADPDAVEGFGEVALTYVCCPTCGDCVNNPSARGVARLDEADPNMPLPIVIFAEPTQGTGPFGNVAVDSGPQGLTWGEDRVLYVGNATANGDYNTADLEKGTVEVVYQFDARVTASAPISPVHVLVALIGGGLYRFNTQTKQAEFVVDLMSDVTSLSQDRFSGLVYAGLADLRVVEIRPFTGDVADFAVMPAKGRVAVSPSGKVWFAPIKYLNQAPLSAWDLPGSL